MTTMKTKATKMWTMRTMQKCTYRFNKWMHEKIKYTFSYYVFLL